MAGFLGKRIADEGADVKKGEHANQGTRAVSRRRPFVQESGNTVVLIAATGCCRQVSFRDLGASGPMASEKNIFVEEKDDYGMPARGPNLGPIVSGAC